MKRLVFLLVFVSCLITRALAYDFEAGNLLYTITSTNPPEVCLEGSVDGEAFQGDLSIPAMVIYDGVEYAVTSVASYAFWHCGQLVGLYVPASVTNIGDGINPFLGTSLNMIAVDDNNPVYHTQGNCIVDERTATLVVGCNNSVIPDDVVHIGKWAFGACLSRMPFIPANVKTIGFGAFAQCLDTSSLVLPNSVEVIGDYAFTHCCFKTIVIPNSIDTIWYESFGYNPYLREIVLSETVSCIVPDAFCYAGNLGKIYSFNPIPPSIGSEPFGAFPNFSNYINLSIYVPQGSVEAYQNAEGWSDCDNIQPIPCWDGTVADAYEGGTGTEEDPYQIATPQQLALLAYETNNGLGGNAYYVLIDDIRLNVTGGSLQWTPIGLSNAFFTGHFDGNDKTISGLLCDTQETIADTIKGLFGCTDRAYISHVNLYDCHINGGSYIGGLVGYAGRTNITYCRIQNSSIKGDHAYSGGLIGYMGMPYGSITDDIDTCRVVGCHIASDVEVEGA